MLSSKLIGKQSSRPCIVRRYVETLPFGKMLMKILTTVSPLMTSKAVQRVSLFRFPATGVSSSMILELMMHMHVLRADLVKVVDLLAKLVDLIDR
eukprot:2207656-Amphidinium_carterae.2